MQWLYNRSFGQFSHLCLLPSEEEVLNSRNLFQNQISFSAGDDNLCWVSRADVMFESRGGQFSDSSSGSGLQAGKNHELIYENL